MYKLNGVPFEDYGVFVSESEGIVNKPKLKVMPSYSWDDYHGESVDLSRKYYEPREITLHCFIKANNKDEFIRNLTRFEQVFDAPYLQRLEINIIDKKPLVYEVYCKDEISVTKKWSEGQMAGTFKLKLIEPEPVKRVLSYTNKGGATATCTITLSSSKLVNVYWGDGSRDTDISGQGRTLTHTYKQQGTYYPIISGSIDELEAFNTNATILWNKL